MPFQTGTNMYNYSRYIVGDRSPYTSIQQAIDAANAAGGGTILIRPGIFTENLTLYSLVNLEGAAGSELVGGVQIIGTHTPPAAGTVSFKRIYFSSPTHIFQSGAAGTTNISLESCLVNCTNGYLFNLANWTGSINVDDVFSNSTNDGFALCTSTATLYVINSSIGRGALNSMQFGGTAGFYNCAIQCPQQFSSTANVILKNCTVTATQTYLNTSSGRSTDTAHLTGITAAIDLNGVGTSVVLENTTIDSAAASVITGTGTATFGSVTYISSTGIAATLTKTYTTRIESGVLKLSDTTVGILNATTGVVAGLGAMTNGQLVIGKTGASPSVATLTAGAGVAITNGAGTITVSSTGGGLTWSTVGASGALAVNNGYVCTAGAALSFSLPGTSAVGDVIGLTLDGSTSWTITQGAGQQVRIGSQQTTAGAGGSLASTAQGDTVIMVCSVANTKWNVYSVVGNITVV